MICNIPCLVADIPINDFVAAQGSVPMRASRQSIVPGMRARRLIFPYVQCELTYKPQLDEWGNPVSDTGSIY